MFPGFYNATPFLNEEVTSFMIKEIPIFKKYDFALIRSLLICGQKSREPNIKKKDTNKAYPGLWKKTERMVEWMKVNKKIITYEEFVNYEKGNSNIK